MFIVNNILLVSQVVGLDVRNGDKVIVCPFEQ